MAKQSLWSFSQIGGSRRLDPVPWLCPVPNTMLLSSKMPAVPAVPLSMLLTLAFFPKEHNCGKNRQKLIISHYLLKNGNIQEYSFRMSRLMAAQVWLANHDIGHMMQVVDLQLGELNQAWAEFECSCFFWFWHHSYYLFIFKMHAQMYFLLCYPWHLPKVAECRMAILDSLGTNFPQ